MQYIWSCSENSFANLDEREDCEYYEIYNDKTDRIEKKRKMIDKKLKTTMTVASYTFLFIVLVAMVLYQYLMKDLKGLYDEEGRQINPPTMQEKILGYIITTVYSGIVIVFGTSYKKLATIQTNNENYRYQKNHDDALINRLF